MNTWTASLNAYNQYGCQQTKEYFGQLYFWQFKIKMVECICLHFTNIIVQMFARLAQLLVILLFVLLLLEILLSIGVKASAQFHVTVHATYSGNAFYVNILSTTDICTSVITNNKYLNTTVIYIQDCIAIFFFFACNFHFHHILIKYHYFKNSLTFTSLIFDIFLDTRILNQTDIGFSKLYQFARWKQLMIIFFFIECQLKIG